MFTLIKSIPVRRLLSEQGPILGLSIIFAELFYKFHSFTLECLAFLVTWCVLDVVVHVAKRWFAPQEVIDHRVKG